MRTDDRLRVGGAIYLQWHLRIYGSAAGGLGSTQSVRLWPRLSTGTNEALPLK